MATFRKKLGKLFESGISNKLQKKKKMESYEKKDSEEVLMV